MLFAVFDSLSVRIRSVFDTIQRLNDEIDELKNGCMFIVRSLFVLCGHLAWLKMYFSLRRGEEGGGRPFAETSIFFQKSFKTDYL